MLACFNCGYCWYRLAPPKQVNAVNTVNAEKTTVKPLRMKVLGASATIKQK